LGLTNDNFVWRVLATL